MTRIMVDATHFNVRSLKLAYPDPPLVAGYLTGSSNIQWDAADWAYWPDSMHVSIDQGGIGSPMRSPIVRDVESGAWSVGAAVNRNGWITERPTIYCSRSNLPLLVNAGWRGDVWLADPGYPYTNPPEYPGINVVAVQHTYTTTYDVSTVFDDTWPYVAKMGEDMIDATINQNADFYRAFPAGSFKGVTVYRDFLSAENTLPMRIAYRSQAKGYVVAEVTLTKPEPYTVTFAHPDVDAVSVVNHSAIHYCGVTVA